MKKTCHILGSTVAYWEYHADKKPVIVAVHGFRGTHHGLQYIIKELPNYRVIIPDLPGFGDSTPLTKAAHTAEGYTLFLEAFIKQLRLATAPVVLGHSFGSIIVTQFARKHPDELSQLILINPIAKHGSSLVNIAGLAIVRAYYKLGASLPEKTGNRLLGSTLVARLTTLSLAKSKDPDLKKRSFIEHKTHFSKFANRNVLHESFRSSSRDTVEGHAIHVQTPTLLIAGDKDAIVPPKVQHELVDIFPNAQLYIIKNTGHLVHYETPEKAAVYISAFVDD